MQQISHNMVRLACMAYRNIQKCKAPSDLLFVSFVFRTSTSKTRSSIVESSEFFNRAWCIVRGLGELWCGDHKMKQTLTALQN